MSGKIEEYIIKNIKKYGSIHMTLLDPDKTSSNDCAMIAEEAEKGGTSAIMVGGSTLASALDLNKVIKRIKKNVNIPIILFPNGPASISPYADAIWFMSLLNSSNPFYLIDAQAIAAPVIKKYGLETLPLGYIIIGSGGAAGYVGMARKLSYRHPELVLGYSLAAEMLGIRFIYLEAGSGAERPIPASTIELVAENVNIPLIVGGGIREPRSAFTVANSGADIIVTGTLIERENKVKERIKSIVDRISN